MPTEAVDSFVTRQGSQLLLDGEPFRFSGTNIYWLGLSSSANGTTGSTTIAYPSHFRVDDVLATAEEMGVRVVRSSTLGISIGLPASLESSKDEFNSEAFQHIDYAINKAKQHGIRLILPLAENWQHYYGGKFIFVNWTLPDAAKHKGNCTSSVTRFASSCPFYTDSRVIETFKGYVRHLLTHTGTHTGIALRDDPVILAWETGNELAGVPPAWTAEIAKFIKHDLGAKQLVMDGGKASATAYQDPTSSGLLNDDIDIVTDHYFPSDHRKLLEHAEAAKKAGKAFIVGEFDWKTSKSKDLSDFLSAAEGNDAVSGCIYWDMSSHADDMGFVSVTDPYSLHYPGNSAETWTRVSTMRRHAFLMRGIVPPPPHRLPAQPLISRTGGREVTWRGAAAANEYTVQVAEEREGPWQTICNNCVTDYDLPWIDHMRDVTHPVWYRVQGINMDQLAGPFSDPFFSEAGPPIPWTIDSWKQPMFIFFVFAATLLLGLGGVFYLWRRNSASDEDEREVFIKHEDSSKPSPVVELTPRTPAAEQGRGLELGEG